MIKNKDILPPGSVVTLNIIKKEHREAKFLIYKRFVLEEEKSKEYYEYEAMLLPIGTEDGKNIMFNNEQIEEVIFKGYSDEQELKFLEAMQELITKENLSKKKR